MYIKSISLKNFIGIKLGLGLNEIKLKFNKNLDNKINLILGRNGSGKSTLLSLLTPFATTIDNRDKLIISDKEGYKKIIIIDNDNKYVIKHTYSSKGAIKSYISKNNLELNENGNVTSFKEIIKTELGIIENYMKLSRLGDNVINFINLKTADRKNFISMLLPDVSEYIEYYKIINNKHLEVKKMISSINENLKKIGDKDELVKEIKNNKKILNKLNNYSHDITYKLGKIDNKITMYEEKLEEYKNINEEYEKIREFMNKNNYIDCSRDDIDIKNRKLNKLNIKLATIDEKRKNITSEINSIIKELENFKNEKNKLSIELENMNIKVKKINIKDELDYYEDKLNEIDNKLKNRKKEIKYIEKKKYITRDIETYLTVINKINTTIEQVENILEYDLNKQLNIDYSEDEILNKIDNLTDRLELYIKQLIENKAKLKDKDKINLVPENCKNNKCYFRNEFIKSLNVEKDIDNLNNIISKTNKILDNYKDKLENVKKVQLLNQAINKVKSVINSNKDYFKNKNFELFKLKIDEVIYILFNKTYNSNRFIKNNKYDFELLLEISNLLDDKKETKDKIKLCNTQLELDNSKISHKNFIENEINKITKKYHDKYIICKGKYGELDLLLDKKKILENKIDKLTKYIETYNEMKVYKDKEKEIKIKLDELIEIKNKYDDIFNRKIKFTNKYEHTERSINLLEAKIEDASYYLKRYEEYIEELTKYEKDYNKLEVIKLSLSPQKGIPLIFIQEYLNKIKLDANKLLDLAFENNKIFINNFILTEKDFFIEIIKDDGSIIKDIKYCSQGETAIINIAISLALIKHNMDKYNILLFDEIDGMLDKNNRTAFIDIINKQIELLNIEQVFVISHNNNFDNYPLNIILMDNDKNLYSDINFKNKTILWKK